MKVIVNALRAGFHLVTHLVWPIVGRPTRQPDPGSAVWIDGLRIVVAGAAASLLGAVLAVMTTHENQLFHYSKDR